MNLFPMVRRKDKDGRIVDWIKTNAVPRDETLFPDYINREKHTCAEFLRQMIAKGFDVGKKEEKDA